MLSFESDRITVSAIYCRFNLSMRRQRKESSGPGDLGSIVADEKGGAGAVVIGLCVATSSHPCFTFRESIHFDRFQRLTTFKPRLALSCSYRNA